MMYDDNERLLQELEERINRLECVLKPIAAFFLIFLGSGLVYFSLLIIKAIVKWMIL